MASTREVLSDDNKTLRVVQQEHADKPAELVEALAFGPVKSVVVLADGQQNSDAALKPRLMQLLGRGLLRAVREAQALCVVRAGFDGLLGSVLADSGQGMQVLGVAPNGRVVVPGEERDAEADAVPPVPGLTHLLLTTAGPWGSELRTKIDMAAALAGPQPGLLVVVGGGDDLMVEVRQAVRQRWPVLVVKGSGAAADALARQWESGVAIDDDPVVAEILADGHLTCIALGEKVGEAVETVTRQVLRGTGGESVLRQAWRRFGAIDEAANRQQTDFLATQKRILLMGVLAVLLSIVYSQMPEPPKDAKAVWGILDWARWLLGYVLIAVPIGISLLIAVTNRFKPGKRWVLMRSASESIKREIYRYRLRAAGYTDNDPREKKLAEAIEDITRRLSRTEANTMALPIYKGPIPPVNTASPRDDGMSLLSTDQYVALRLEDQLSFYRRKTVTLEAELSRLQIYVLLAGAAGTLLAAFGGNFVIWIALTTAVASAVMTYLSYRQTESTLTGYNQTATDLDNILSWWTSLEPEEQALRGNIETLATHTEQVLADELSSWTQRMTDALEKLRETQAEKDEAKRAAAQQEETDRQTQAQLQAKEQEREQEQAKSQQIGGADAALPAKPTPPGQTADAPAVEPADEPADEPQPPADPRR